MFLYLVSLASFLCFLTFGLRVVLCLWVVAAVWGMAPAHSAQWRTWWTHSTVRVPLASHLHGAQKSMYQSEMDHKQDFSVSSKKRTLSYLPSRCTWPMAVCRRKPLRATFQRACGWPCLYCPWWFPPPHSHLSSSTWPAKRHCKTERKIPWHHRVGLQSSWWWPVAVSRCCCCVTLSLAHMVAGLGDFNETQGRVMSSDMS